MKHYLNVCGVNGADVDPVDVITFGSPCQDMSIAGKRKGIKHSEHGNEETTRSGLFYEAIRIIKEMREATHGEYPKYAVWENVPGAFSSNKGWDFLAVLEALCSVCDSTVSIPEPHDKKRSDKLVWNGAGEIVGNNFSICWRTLDAQYWGVPQRRKRIYLVADFNTRCAREILFKPESLRGNMPQGNDQGKEIADDAVGSTDGSVGNGVNENNCLNSYDVQSRRIFSSDGLWPSLYGGQGGGHGYVCAAFMAGQGAKAGSIAYSKKISPTLKSTLSGGNTIPSVIVQDGSTVARTLAARYDSSPCVDRGQNVIAYDTRNHKAQDVSATIQAKPGGGTSLNFINSVCYQNTGRGWWNQSEIAETLRTPSGGDSTKANLVSLCYDARSNGDGETVSTITGDHESRITDYTALALYARQRSDEFADCGLASCESACQYKSATDLVVQKSKPPRKYIIRRLIPIECARLQGFPDRWGELAPFNPDDTEFWESVRKTYAEINGKKYRPAKNLKKWYDKLHNDGSEYKMWGNGIALPCAEYVLHGISEHGAKTLGSLFDGSGGFPIAGALNGIIPLWSSEIEPYPIAVTKSRFL